MELTGLIGYLIPLLTFAGIYAVLSLGLNVQWGFAGLFNIGIAAFFAVGAYTSTILTTPPSPNYLGGFDLPFPVGLIGAMAASGLLALLTGLVTLNLRADYLAIATIGIGEIVRLILKNEAWLTHGVRGIKGIPKPFGTLSTEVQTLVYLLIVLAIVLIVYLAIERLSRAPWGRVLRAIRENELAASAVGKNVMRFRLEAFILGSMIMGLGGALYAHSFGFISPEAFDPLFATFLVWIMLIAGGSGNNRGAILGALVIWFIWSITGFLANRMPPELMTQAAALRPFLIGLLLQIILLARPQGILKEKPPFAPGDEEERRGR